jgi:hypothetical protein
MASSSRAATKQLMRVLASPSKVANALDWRRSTGGAIATLDIHADRIGVRISQHPKNRNNTKQQDYSLPVSPRGRTKIPESTRQQLSDLVHQHKVCGFVVAWPLQQDTGMMGAACGRTLFAIEELLRTDLADTTSSTSPTSEAQNTSTRPVFLPNRPLCLWDSSHSNEQQTTDVFGRSPLYARTSDKTKHLASQEQYHQDESLEGSGIWDDFVKTHWPDSHKNEERLLTSSRHKINMTMWNRDESSSQQRTQAAAAV